MDLTQHWRVIEGDCLDVLKTLEPGSVDAIITDPPYGTGWVRGGGKRAGVFPPRRERALWDVWSLSWLDVAPLVPVAMFCPNSRHDEVVVRLGGVVAWWLKTNPRPNGPDREPIALRGFAELEIG